MNPLRADGYAYYVGTRPQMTWAWDLQERNLRFLRSIDPGYYRHIARVHGPLLEGDDAGAQYAAATIRIAHGQATETLFALLGAFTQAPHRPIGWMLAYSNAELRSVVDRLASYEGMTEFTQWKGTVTLDELSAVTLECSGWDAAKQTLVAEAFARVWHLWAGELLDENRVFEYNSLKHGSRAALGGFTLAIGQEVTYGVPAPAENMRSLGGSNFGSTFFTPNEVHGKLHRYPRSQSHNWSAVALVSGLDLLAMSIQNVLSYLRITGGDDPAECTFVKPADESAFDLPFTATGGMSSMSMDLNLTDANIERLTKEQVVGKLRRSET